MTNDTKHDTGGPLALRLTEGLGPLVGSEEDPVRRVNAEARIDLGKYAGTYGGYTTDSPKPRTLWQRFQAWRERTGFLMDGRDGGM